MNLLMREKFTGIVLTHSWFHTILQLDYNFLSHVSSLRHFGKPFNHSRVDNFSHKLVDPDKHCCQHYTLPSSVIRSQQEVATGAGEQDLGG